MDSRLLVPASAALLDGWCGPVVLLDPHERGSDLVGAHLYRDGQVSVFADWTARRTWSTSVSSIHGVLDRVMLDLSRAECRDRIIRALIAMLWPGDRLDRVALDGGPWASDRFDGWTLGTWNRNWSAHFRAGPPARETADEHSPYTWLIRLPGLAGIDCLDDTRSPDGSRLADNLALAAVAREVLRG